MRPHKPMHQAALLGSVFTLALCATISLGMPAQTAWLAAGYAVCLAMPFLLFAARRSRHNEFSDRVAPLETDTLTQKGRTSLTGTLDGVPVDIDFSPTKEHTFTFVAVHVPLTDLELRPSLTQPCPWLDTKHGISGPTRDFVSWLDAPARAQLQQLLDAGWMLQDGTVRRAWPGEPEDDWQAQVAPVIKLAKHWRTLSEQAGARLLDIVATDPSPDMQLAAMQALYDHEVERVPGELPPRLDVERALRRGDLDTLTRYAEHTEDTVREAALAALTSLSRSDHELRGSVTLTSDVDGGALSISEPEAAPRRTRTRQRETH